MKVSVSQVINCGHTLPGTEFHGHTYRVTVTLRGRKRNDDKVMSFDYLAGCLSSVLRGLDHKHLNGVLAVAPTAENLAEHIRDGLVGDLLRKKNLTVRVEVGNDGWVETE